MMRIFVVAILFILFDMVSVAQYYENGQDPFSIKWKKIETPHFRVIFSDDIVSMGKTYAAYFEQIYKTAGITLGHNPRKIPIIIHNQNVLSNGEVAWAPKRMNLYTVPPQTGYSEPHNKNLALHEFRHVVQIDKLNQHSTRVLYYIFGEQAIGVVLGWHIPRWFFEGDAVAYETGASKLGRGRIPDFTMKIKAQVHKYGIYSYPKAQFGSYKSFVPNHYELGYQLISRSRQKYGYSLWEKTIYQIAKSPIHPNAFSKGIKKVTGLPERKLYSELMNDFSTEISHDFSTEITHKTSNKSETTDKQNDYINYYSPHEYGKGIISYKTSYSDIPRIVVTKPNGVEKTVYTPGSIFNQTFSYNDSVLVWNEFKATRWQNDNYNRIVLFNLKTDKKKYIAKKSRAYHSRISPDNSKILSVEVDKFLKWSITIRNAFSGEIIESIVFDKEQLLQPTWSPDMSEVVFFKLGENGKLLSILNLHSHLVTELFLNDSIDVSFPVHCGDAIIIKGVYNNASNFLRYDLTTKQWTAITDAKYGVGEGSFKNSEFIYSNYTPNGYELQRVKNENLLNKQIQNPEIYETKLVKQLEKDEQIVNLTDIDTAFTVEKYSRLKYLFNFHSWAPLGINIQNIEVGPGVTLMSQNALSTTTLAGGYQYNIADQSNRYYADFSYKGFYPILNSKFSKTYYQKYIKDDSDSLHLVKYNDLSIYLSAYLPFNFDRGKWFRRFQPQIAYEYRDITPLAENTIKLTSPKIHSLYYQLYMYNLLRTSHRDLQSRWGQIFKFRYMSSPFNKGQMGWLASAEAWLYLPGIVKNHGLRIYGGYQLKEYGDYDFTDRIAYPYGYTYQANTQLVSVQANYQLPILYPDLNVFEYVYIKMIKANAFYQYLIYEYNNTKSELSSVGTDLTFDLHLFRFALPFEFGVRYARRLTYNDNYFQFIYKMRF